MYSTPTWVKDGDDLIVLNPSCSAGVLLLFHYKNNSVKTCWSICTYYPYSVTNLRARVAQWVRYLDYLTTHISLSQIWHGFAPGFVNYKKGCTRLAAASDKVYQLLAHGRWFSPGTLASSTTKTGRHDIAEILLKVALNIINQIKINQSVANQFCSYSFHHSCLVVWHNWGLNPWSSETKTSILTIKVCITLNAGIKLMFITLVTYIPTWRIRKMVN
jgi:hypothetical protein